MTLRRAPLLITLTLILSALAAPTLAEDLVRADFQNESDYALNGGIFGDDGAEMEDMDMFSCLDPVNALPEDFDFVDWRDDDLACVGVTSPASDGVLSITWGPGRWKFQTGPAYMRSVGLNFKNALGDPIETAANCARLDNLEFSIGGEAASDDASNSYGNVTCGCGGPCTALATFRVDSVFKRGANRQDVSFPIRLESGAPAVLVDYVNPLFVCPEDPPDDSVRFLQTDSCDGDPVSSVAEAEVFEVVQSGGGTEILIGRWNMPLKVRLRRLPIPDAGDGGGGGNTCELPAGQKGDLCVLNSDCCSGKCGGKPGRKTCK